MIKWEIVINDNSYKLIFGYYNNTKIIVADAEKNKYNGWDFSVRDNTKTPILYIDEWNKNLFLKKLEISFNNNLVKEAIFNYLFEGKL